MREHITPHAGERKLTRRHDEDDSTWQDILRLQKKAHEWAQKRNAQRRPSLHLIQSDRRGAA